MDIGGGIIPPVFCFFFFVVVVAVVVPSLVAAAGQSAAAEVPCFGACFDQCVPRHDDEFWFCQFSCYRRCAGAARRGVVGDDDGCERACVVSLCGRLRPGSKMMVACRDTCRKSYATAACRTAARDA